MPQLHEIRPNLWICESRSAQIQVRAALVMGERYALVWDALARPDDVTTIVEAIDDKPYYLVYSHADWDHIWGAAGFLKRPVSVIAHSDCLRRFGDDVPRTLQRMQQSDPGTWDAVRLIPPNLTFTSALSLDLGGITVELRHAPGHTIDSIVCWIPAWGVLLGGDAIETPLPVVNDVCLVRGWLRALEGWQQETNLSLSIPSHGSMEGRASLDQTVAYLRALTGDRKFKLSGKLASFYRETHQKNLIIVDGGLELHD
jgi:glyoxylase-like metal-dependent hydrolase (beta-lactamase superfamily II)